MQIYELKSDKVRKITEVNGSSPTDLKLNNNQKNNDSNNRRNKEEFDKLFKEELEKLKEEIITTKETSISEDYLELTSTYKRIR